MWGNFNVAVFPQFDDIKTLPDTYDCLVTALENFSENDLTLETVKQWLLAEKSNKLDRMEECCEDRSAVFVGEGRYLKSFPANAIVAPRRPKINSLFEFNKMTQLSE